MRSRSTPSIFIPSAPIRLYSCTRARAALGVRGMGRLLNIAYTKMRGDATSPRAARSRRASSFATESFPTSRTVVIPVASQVLSAYSTGCGTPPRESCTCACTLISPGRTNFPVASISASAAGRRARPPLTATGSSHTTSAIVFPSITTSASPRAGVPLPSGRGGGA